jgi:predicted nucleotidyltransferase
MIDIGLSEKEIGLMKDVFAGYHDIEKVVIFGSRAKGTARNNSDVDFAIWGIKDELQIAAIAMDLDDLPLPYKFDVVSFLDISNTALQEHIERVGVLFYRS